MRKAPEMPELNTGSSADIAFLLLIFFLVTTTFDTDKGIIRMLPPIVEKQEKSESKVKERNVFVVLVNAKDQLLVEGELMDIRQLREKTKEFLLNPEDLPSLPEKEEKDIPYFGKVRVGKGVISLQNDRGTSYGKYLEVQNELTAAGNEIKDQIAMQKFNKHFDDLSEDQQNAIKQYVPVMISEAEPKNIGADKGRK
ncbi:MAG: biopolymer transporter ExbD [Bacteroidales bacterium]|jgi:biopolymer transport protein ExbD|nr:biopolymer transporter ExbD [Bacteroidales bacterium]